MLDVYCRAGSGGEIRNIYLVANYYTQSSITYTLNGGTNASSNPTSNYEGKEEVTISAPSAAPTGYTFAGWTGSNGDTPHTSVTISANDTDSKSYTANWTANTYYVAFDGNGATSGSMANQTFTYDTALTLTSNSYTRSNYVFNGWNTAKDGSGTAYTDGQSVLNLTSTANATVTLYAQWKSVEDAASALASSSSGEGDVSGSSFCDLLARSTKQTKTSITLKWKKIKEADGYIIYGNKCGKTFILKAKEVNKSKNIAVHRKICYESTDTSVATVNKNGKIKAVAKGSCYVYVFAQNGIYTKLKVTVK